MEKIVEYFSHDTNANQDPKMMLLIAQLGLEGYGIFWILIEYLAQQPGYRAPIIMLDPLSRRFGVSREKFEAIVKNYGLFEYNDNEFYSESLLKRLSKLESIREQRRAAIMKRWHPDALTYENQESENKADIYGSNTGVIREYYGSNTGVIQSKVKESKVKESKVKESKVKESKVKEKKEEESPSFSFEVENLLLWIESSLKTKEPIFPEKYFPAAKLARIKWMQCIEKLLKEGYSTDEIKQAIIYARTDNFWCQNFLSLLKLDAKDKFGVRYIDRFLEECRRSSPKKIAACNSGEDVLERIKRVAKEGLKNNNGHEI
ncbi:MAG: DUF4373 domain-containing protein [Bacteroidales bacterium]|nr:DUF4373 domain-containing protein [Bacteroidales bacterium]